MFLVFRLVVVLMICISVPQSFAGCGSACTSSAQCANPCPFCFEGECGSCCDQLADDSTECTAVVSECYWNTDVLPNECEDSPGLGCPNQEIPENPKGSHLIWMGLALAILTGVAWKYRRQPKNSSSQ